MTEAWIKAALTRAIKTMAQTAVSLLGTGAMGILDVDWISILSASALAGILSILTSIAGLPEVDAAATSLQTEVNEDDVEELYDVEADEGEEDGDEDDNAEE